MDAVAAIVGVSWMLLGLLTIGLAIPLLLGKVGRNRVYGVRFLRSFESDEAWYAINRYGAKRMLVWAPLLIAVGLVALFLPLRTHPGWTIVFGFAPLVFVIVPAAEAWKFARNYRRDT